MIARAVAAGVPFAWFTADEAYGQAKWLQAWLEDQDIWYVMAIRCSDTLTTAEGERRADDLIAAVPAAVLAEDLGRGRGARPARVPTGPGSRSGPAGSAAAGTGCWPAGRSATRPRSPTTPATGPAGPAPPTWPGPRAAAGISRSACSRPKARPGSTSTRSAPGGPGTPTSPCPCSRWPGWRPARPRR